MIITIIIIIYHHGLYIVQCTIYSVQCTVYSYEVKIESVARLYYVTHECSPLFIVPVVTSHTRTHAHTHTRACVVIIS